MVPTAVRHLKYARLHERRYLAITDDAIDTLIDLCRHGDTDATRLKASLALLDRAGVDPKGHSDENDDDEDLPRAKVDLSRLSIEELTQFKKLHDIAAGIIEVKPEEPSN